MWVGMLFLFAFFFVFFSLFCFVLRLRLLLLLVMIVSFAESYACVSFVVMILLLVSWQSLKFDFPQILSCAAPFLHSLPF